MMLLVSLLAAAPLSPVPYLDPGSGSFILQLLLGAVVGLLVALKAYWGKIKTLFSREESAAGEEEQESPPAAH